MVLKKRLAHHDPCMFLMIVCKTKIIYFTFCRTSRYLISYGSFDGRVRKWDITDGTNTKTPFDPLGRVDIRVCVPLMTSENVTGIYDELVFVPIREDIAMMRIWDGARLKKLTGHFKAVTSIAFCKSRLELISGSTDRAILLWDCNQNVEKVYDEYLAGEKKSYILDRSSRRRLHNISESTVDLTHDAWSSDDSD
jgi:WD40 repeat protein